jgi:hypothetical protein
MDQSDKVAESLSVGFVDAILKERTNGKYNTTAKNLILPSASGPASR